MLNLAMYESLTSEQLPSICMIILLEYLQIQFGADCFKAGKYTFMKKVIYYVIYLTFCASKLFFQCFEVMKAHMEILKKKKD